MHTRVTLPPILLVDDDRNDVEFVKRALERARLKHQVHVVPNGLDCVAYLKGDAPFGDRHRFPLPTFVLLDIRMPGMDGFDVLRWIRHQPEFDSICVVMLTGSNERPNVNLAYELGANSFLAKPLDFVNALEFSHSLTRVFLKCQTGHNLRQGPKTTVSEG